MPAPRVLQRAEPAAAFKMLRVLVAPTNDVELAALRCAARCGLPTGGYARAGDYDARVLAPRGVREVFDYDAPERTRRACRDAVLREAARVLVLDNPACAWAPPADGRAVVVRGAHVRLPCPRAAVAVVCCPEPAPWARAWLHATFLRWRAEAAMHPRVRALRQRHAPPQVPRRRAAGPSRLR